MPSHTPPPVLDCVRLTAFDAADLGDVRRAFAAAPEVAMQQAWRDTPEPTFARAVVRAGWREQSLYVWAALTDADIFSAATDHNQRFWELGDAFEMFFQPATQAAYVELQVTPNNHRLQLKFPDETWRMRVSKDDAVSKALMAVETFSSRVWVEADAGQWHVLATIPADAVRETPRDLAGDRWKFSFSRYDYTSGHDAPVISSTSPHAQPGFHRLHEFGELRFQA
ncbi:MAG: hypothetical protein KAY59_09610 [Acidobacteria bacterium]|nr:hypothetical protein [Acidobacteriota bacterium]